MCVIKKIKKSIFFSFGVIPCLSFILLDNRKTRPLNDQFRGRSEKAAGKKLFFCSQKFLSAIKKKNAKILQQAEKKLHMERFEGQ